MATTHYLTLFMSATQKINLEEFKSVLMRRLKRYM
jgi:hypothetical protein